MTGDEDRLRELTELKEHFTQALQAIEQHVDRRPHDDPEVVLGLIRTIASEALKSG